MINSAFYVIALSYIIFWAFLSHVPSAPFEQHLEVGLAGVPAALAIVHSLRMPLVS
jgi:hypothetical protein